MLIIGLLGAFAIYIVGLVRNQQVYRERFRWLRSPEVPCAGDPEFYQKMARLSHALAVHERVSYSEMFWKFWIPVGDFWRIGEVRLREVDHED